MIISSSRTLPVPREPGKRSVPAVAGPAKQTLEPRQLETAAHGSESNAGTVDAETFVDTEFVEVVRSRALTVRPADTANGTWRRALAAYQTAEEWPPLRGVIIDVAT